MVVARWVEDQFTGKFPAVLVDARCTRVLRMAPAPLLTVIFARRKIRHLSEGLFPVGPASELFGNSQGTGLLHPRIDRLHASNVVDVVYYTARAALTGTAIVAVGGVITFSP